MALTPEEQQTLDSLKEIRSSGANSTTVDGLTVSFDMATVNRLIQELERQDEATASRKPTVSTILLNKPIP